MTTFRCFWVEGKFQHAAVLTQSTHTPREIHSVNTLYNIKGVSLVVVVGRQVLVL